MKLLQLNICFKLPDNFEGDENDAIQTLLDYRRSEKNHKGDYQYNPNLDIYDNWWEMVNTTDRVLMGSMGMYELNENGEWDELWEPDENEKCDPIK